MLDIERRWSTSIGCLAVLILGSCGEGFDAGGSGLHELPDTSWRGDFIDFGTDVDASICPQTLPSLDEYMGGVDEHIRSGASFPIRYLHLSKDLTDYGFGCPPGSYGCIGHDNGSVVVGSKQLSLKHELIHASSATNGHRILEEGLATFLGTDLYWWGIAEPLDIRGAFESVEGTTSFLPAEFYPVAGHFVSVLVEEQGLPSVVSLVEASAPGMTLDELDDLALEHLGRDIRSAIDAYEASGPGCEVAQYSPTWFECEFTPPSIPIFACTPNNGTVHVDIDLSCANGASGVQDGMIWRDVLVDIPAPAHTLIYLYEGHPVDFIVRACGQGCSTPFAEVSSESTEPAPIFDTFDVVEGLNVVRIFKPIEAEGRVRFDIGGLCP